MTKPRSKTETNWHQLVLTSVLTSMRRWGLRSRNCVQIRQWECISRVCTQDGDRWWRPRFLGLGLGKLSLSSSNSWSSLSMTSYPAHPTFPLGHTTMSFMPQKSKAWAHPKQLPKSSEWRSQLLALWPDTEDNCQNHQPAVTSSSQKQQCGSLEKHLSGGWRWA